MISNGGNWDPEVSVLTYVRDSGTKQAHVGFKQLLV